MNERVGLALTEYKRVCAIVRGEEYWAVGRSDVADAADAALAEMEAEVQHQIERREEEKLRAVNAEAERDALRCCGNCGHYEQDPDFVGECDASGMVAEEHQAFADGRYLVCHHVCIFTPGSWQPRDGGGG